MGESLGDLLVQEKILTSEQLRKIYAKQRAEGGRFLSRLIETGIVSEEELTRFLSHHFEIPMVHLDDYEIDKKLLEIIPDKLMRNHPLLPLNRAGSTLVVAVADPSDLEGVDELKFLTNSNVELVIAPESEIYRVLAQYREAKGDGVSEIGDYLPDIDIESVGKDYDIVHDEEEVDITDLAKAYEEAPLVRLVNYILADAIRKRASDIHIEAYEKVLRIRYRIDGVLYEGMKPPFRLKNALVSRIKVMSRLDIAERRLPQDGRFKLRLGTHREIDFRVSVLPCIHGEKVVMRLLDKASLQLDMTKLGFEESDLTKFKKAIHQPYGMVLVTGPTGSGKTTTLYSALSELNRTDVNISTAEDPVEYNLYGINQVQMHEEIGLTFATALRSFLRQDPDIIMVGEIRDLETAEIAIKAALTGHLVLSTLHTNDAPSTVTRLLNMGIEPFLVTTSLNCVVAQRLVRQICENCKVPTTVSDQLIQNLGIDSKEITFYEGRGCDVCNQTGYKGRIGLYEVLMISDEIKKLILAGGSSDDLRECGMEEGMRSLREVGIEKLKEGKTTMSEVLRVTAI